MPSLTGQMLMNGLMLTTHSYLVTYEGVYSAALKPMVSSCHTDAASQYPNAGLGVDLQTEFHTQLTFWPCLRTLGGSCGLLRRLHQLLAEHTSITPGHSHVGSVGGPVRIAASVIAHQVAIALDVAGARVCALNP
jgi:hypothetical protein